MLPQKGAPRARFAGVRDGTDHDGISSQLSAGLALSEPRSRTESQSQNQRLR